MSSKIDSKLEIGRPRAPLPPAASWSRDDSDSRVRLEELFTVETALYAGAIFLGVALRLLLLDMRPLSVEEGSLAAQAYRIMLGQMPDALRDGPLPSYATAVSLGLFGYSDGAARLLSALAGSTLIAIPLLLRGVVGRLAAVFAAYGFAFSPLLLFASRDVGSGIVPALLSTILWWAGGRGLKPPFGRWPAVTALALAGLVTCGPSGVTAAVAIGLAALLSHPNLKSLISELRSASNSQAWRRAGLVFMAATLAIGAGFGVNPAGIQSVLVDVWVGWLGSLSQLSPRGGLLVTMSLYELPVLIVALGRLLTTVVRRDRTDTFLSLWTMVLLLTSMIQSTDGLSKLILPMIPMYFLAARSVAGSLPAAGGGRSTWQWVVGSVSVAIPTGVAVVILNRASLLGQEVPNVFLYGEVALVLCGALVIALVLDGPGRRTLAWGAAIVVGLSLLLHTTFFLNFRQDSAPSELVLGQQVSPLLRDAAMQAAYFNSYFASTVTVDPQLRSALEWYLRGARSIDYSSEASKGISIGLGQAGQYVVPPPAERGPGLYATVIDPSKFTWQGVWGWLVARDGLVRTNQRDIILRAPAGNW